MNDVLVERGAVRPAGMPDDVPAVPDVPEISGLRFRAIGGSDDYALIARLDAAAAEADGIGERHTADEVENWLSHDQHRDVRRDIVLAEVDGDPVAIAFAGWELDNDGGHDYQTWGVVAPAWRRRGIGTALLHWVEQRQRQVAAAHRPKGEKRMEAWAYAREAGRVALLEREGYRIVRTTYEMERPNLDAIPEAVLPERFAWTDGPSADPREVWNVVGAAFSDHFGGSDHSEEAYQGFLRNPQRNTALWVLVTHEGHIVATALNRISEAENEALGIKRGRVNAVAVLRDFRRRGLGRAVVARSLRVLRDAGMRTATLGVDAANPHGAVGIYEKLGFGVIEEGRVYRKPIDG